MYDFHALCQRISGGVGVFNNAFLIFLIVFHSPKKLGTYKYLMIYISVFELIYAVLDVLTAPEIFSKDSSFFVLINAEKTVLPEYLIFSATVMFSSMFGTSIAIFAIHFIYRYVTVTSHSLQTIFVSWKFLIWLFFPLIFGILWSLDINLTLTSNPAGEQFLEQEYLLKTNNSISQVYYIGPYYYPKKVNGTDYFSWKPFVGTGCMLVANSLSILLIFYFGLKCYNHMKTVLPSSAQSAQFKNLQKQLFYALFFQTLIPVVLMHTPAFFIFIATFLDCSFELLGQIPSITIVMYPFMDPLPNIFIIRNYRIATINYFKMLISGVFRIKTTKIGIDDGQKAATNDTTKFDNRSSVFTS